MFSGLLQLVRIGGYNYFFSVCFSNSGLLIKKRAFNRFFLNSVTAQKKRFIYDPLYICLHPKMNP
jgi:hypothetical protein